MTAAADRVRPVTSECLWWGVEEVPAGWGPCVVTIGVFDGVHRGHAALITRAVDRARARGLPTVLVTFDPHPARVVGPARDTRALSTLPRRAQLAHELGVHAVLVLPFTPQLARLPAEEFVARVLVERLHAAAVVVGRDFRFGSQGTGTVDTLRLLGRRWGFVAEGIDLVAAVQDRCSSTHVRACLARGDVAAAAAALARPHRMEGQLLGSALSVPDDTALPATGSYAALLHVDGASPVPVQATISPDGSLAIDGVVPAVEARPASLEFPPGPRR